jgi:hypothetical protein
MSRTLLAGLALATLAACGRGDRQEVAAADSLNRDLQLAPVDTTATLADTAATVAPTPEPTPAPAPKPAAPKPKPSPKPKPAAPAPNPLQPAAQPAPAPAPASRNLAAGASLSAATDAEIRSNKNKVGDEVTATVAKDVKNADGVVVIPAGSQVTLRVTAIKPSDSKSDTTGTLQLKPTSVTIKGSSYPITASISHVKTELQGRGTNAADLAKPAGGAAAGAIVGRVLGGNSKGAIIGGIIGGAVGTQRMIETKDRDVVLPQGTTVTITLDQGLTASS